MSLILSSLRLGLRQVFRRPGESATAIVVLALGIGLAATGWAVVWGTYLRPVPVPDGDRLVRVALVDAARPDGLTSLYYETFQQLRQRQAELETIDRLEAWTPLGYDVSGLDGPSVRVPGAAVTAGLLELAGAEPIEGRLLTEEDEHTGARVAVASEEFWRRHLNSEPVASEPSLVIYGQRYVVVGVLPSGLRFPYGQDLWLPARKIELNYVWSQTLARLAVDTQPAAAQAELQAAVEHLPPPEAAKDDDGDHRLAIEPLRDTYHDDGVRTAVLAAAGASVGILLLACANVANLLLARGLRRQREMAVRTSLGARRHQLLGQLLVETSTLGVAGGVLGLLLCRGGIHLWGLYSEEIGTPFWSSVHLDSQVLWMIVGLVTLSCVAAGLFPAWRQSADVTRAGGHETARSSSDRWLVVAQVAVSVALLATCGVFVRTVERLEAGRDHLRQPDVFTAGLSILDRSGQEDDEIHATWGAVLRELGDLPEVASVALASHLPEDGEGWAGRAAAADGRQVDAAYGVASPGLASALGLRVLAGRDFDTTDRSEGDRVAWIDADLASAVFPRMNPQEVVGRTIRFGQAGPKFEEFPERTIVGVVADLGPGTPNVEGALASPSGMPQAFLPLTQTTMTGGTLVFRMRSTAAASEERIATAIERAAPGHPLNRFQPLSQRLDDDLVAQSSARSAFLVLSAVALALAAAGLYGVLAVSVGRKRRELAVRTALGATPRDLLRRVLGSGLAMVATGSVAGLFLGYLSTRAVRSLLHGAAPWDPVALTAAVTILLAAGFVASWIPARRAARVQPSSALKEE